MRIQSGAGKFTLIVLGEIWRVLCSHWAVAAEIPGETVRPQSSVGTVSTCRPAFQPQPSLDNNAPRHPPLSPQPRLPPGCPARQVGSSSNTSLLQQENNNSKPGQNHSSHHLEILKNLGPQGEGTRAWQSWRFSGLGARSRVERACREMSDTCRHETSAWSIRCSATQLLHRLCE